MAGRKQVVIILLLSLSASCTQESAPPSAEQTTAQYTPDAATGRALFIDKACVTCHAVNGVGGKAAPALDAQTEMDQLDVAGFAARMWRGAPAMVELQSIELGYTMWLDADELTNLAAFAASASEQKKLTIDDISEGLRDSFLNERIWEVEDWDEFQEQGQEDYSENDRQQ